MKPVSEPTKKGSMKYNMKYKLNKRISKHQPEEIWEVRENECVFITSIYGVISEYVPSANWQPYFLKDNANNGDYFTKIDSRISKTDGGLFVIDPARRQVTEYISRVLEDDGTELNKKVNELIDVVNKLVEDSQ